MDRNSCLILKPSNVSRTKVFLAKSLVENYKHFNIENIFKLLQNHGADPNVILPDDGVSPFHLVIGNQSERFATEVTKMFLRFRGDPNIRSDYGFTPLHIAAAWGRTEIIHLLLLNGGDPWMQDDDMKTAFNYAFEEQKWKAVEMLHHFQLMDSCLKTKIEHENCTKSNLERVWVSNRENVVVEYVPFEKLQTIHSDDSKRESNYFRHSKPSSPVKELSKFFENNSDIDNKMTIETKKVNNTWNKDLYQTSGPVTVHKEEKQIEVSPPKLKYDQSEPIFITKRNLFPQTEQNFKRSKSFAVSKTDHGSDKRNDLFTELKQVFKARSLAKLNKEQNLVEGLGDKADKEFGGNKLLQQLSDVATIVMSNQDCQTFDIKLSGDKTSKLETDQIPKQMSVTEGMDYMPGNMNGEMSTSFFNLTQDIDPMTEEIMDHKTANLTEDHDQVLGFVNLTEDNDQVSGIVNLTEDLDHVTENSPKHIFNLAEDFEHKSEKMNWTQDINPISEKINLSDENYLMKTTESDNLSEKLLESTNFESCDSLVDSNDNVPILYVPDCNNVPTSNENSAFVSVCEEYKVCDELEGVVLVERHHLVSSNLSILTEDLSDVKSSTDSLYSTLSSVPSSLNYDTDTLRTELIEQGCVPGPILKNTKQLYMRRLYKLKKRNFKMQKIISKRKLFSQELENTLQNQDNYQTIKSLSGLEDDMCKIFNENVITRSWREGSYKTSFNYLLLDPRITMNLPKRTDTMNMLDTWLCFLTSIFYVGKGKKSRPYSHLYEALPCLTVTDNKNVSPKIQHIIDIWRSDVGVVCLHVFHNVIPVEAYTREASLIDALGKQNLKNAKCGDYYGPASTWNSKTKRKLGVYLLYRALQIFLNEGERQIRPADIHHDT